MDSIVRNTTRTEHNVNHPYHTTNVLAFIVVTQALLTLYRDMNFFSQRKRHVGYTKNTSHG